MAEQTETTEGGFETAEQQAQGPVVVAEVPPPVEAEATETATEEVAATPEPEAKAKVGELDKTRQQIQQEVGNKLRPFEQRLEQMQESIQQLIEMRAEQGKGPTDAQQRTSNELEALQKEIDALEAEGTPLDGRSLKTLSKLLDSKLGALNQQVGTLAKRIETRDQQTEAAQQAEAMWKQWDRDNSDVASVREKLLKDAYDSVVEDFPDLTEPDAFVKVANRVFLRKVEAHRAAALIPQPRKSPIAPPAKLPPKPTVGAQVLPKGSSASRSAPTDGDGWMDESAPAPRYVPGT